MVLILRMQLDGCSRTLIVSASLALMLSAVLVVFFGAMATVVMKRVLARCSVEDEVRNSLEVGGNFRFRLVFEHGRFLSLLHQLSYILYTL